MKMITFNARLDHGPHPCEGVPLRIHCAGRYHTFVVHRQEWLGEEFFLPISEPRTGLLVTRLKRLTRDPRAAKEIARETLEGFIASIGPERFNEVVDKRIKLNATA